MSKINFTGDLKKMHQDNKILFQKDKSLGENRQASINVKASLEGKAKTFQFKVNVIRQFDNSIGYYVTASDIAAIKKSNSTNKVYLADSKSLETFLVSKSDNLRPINWIDKLPKLEDHHELDLEDSIIKKTLADLLDHAKFSQNEINEFNDAQKSKSLDVNNLFYEIQNNQKVYYQILNFRKQDVLLIKENEAVPLTLDINVFKSKIDQKLMLKV